MKQDKIDYRDFFDKLEGYEYGPISLKYFRDCDSVAITFNAAFTLGAFSSVWMPWILKEEIADAAYKIASDMEVYRDGCNMVQFETGDVVTLASGGPEMAVEGYDKNSEVKCVWFNDGSVSRCSFMEQQLVKTF